MINKKILQEFKRIKDDHPQAIRARAARVVLGPSVTRVYNKGTKDKLLPLLNKIDIDKLQEFTDQEQFKNWFERELSKIANVIKRSNINNSRIAPGFKWGHATKILTLYLRDIVLNSRYFKDHDIKRISKWLYIPIDGVVIKRLRDIGINCPFKQIREIDGPKKFYDIQDKLGKAAEKFNMPRVWFDDNWGDRQDKKG